MPKVEETEMTMLCADMKGSEDLPKVSLYSPYKARVGTGTTVMIAPGKARVKLAPQKARPLLSVHSFLSLPLLPFFLASL